MRGRRCRRRRAGGLAVALGAAALLSACGSGDGGQAANLPGKLGLEGRGGLSQASRVTCEEWGRGTVEQRRRVISQLGEVFGRDRPYQRGYSLPEDEAYRIVADACGHDYAGGFKLWKLYERGLAFQYPRGMLTD